MGVFSNNSTAATEGGYIHTIIFDDEIESSNRIENKVIKCISEYDKGFKDGYKKAKEEILEKISKALSIKEEELKATEGKPKYNRDPKIDNYIKEEMKRLSGNMSNYDKVIEYDTLNTKAVLTFDNEGRLTICATPIYKSNVRTDIDLNSDYRTLHTLYIDKYLDFNEIYITGVSRILVNDVYKKVIIYNVSRTKPDKSFSPLYDLNLKNPTGEVRRERR